MPGIQAETEAVEMLSAVKAGGAVRRMSPVMQGTFKTALASGPNQESISLDAGHPGILVGPGAMGGLWPRVREWLVPRCARQGE